MSQFVLYFQLGIRHILDINGLDHVLFIIALCSIYILKDWKKVLILVTAFTIGHSVTLALSTLDIVLVRTEIIEFLITVTIFVTAFFNLFKKQFVFQPKRFQTNYIFALLFGLIHGFGFSNYLKSILGLNTGVVMELFAFNLGIELGQIVVVIIFLSMSYILINIFSVPRRDLNLVVSAGIAAIAITLMMETKFW